MKRAEHEGIVIDVSASFFFVRTFFFFFFFFLLLLILLLCLRASTARDYLFVTRILLQVLHIVNI